MTAAPLPEIPTVQDCIDRMMRSRPRARAQLLEHGKFGHIGESCSGPLHPTVTIVAQGLEVERPTPEQWASEVNWHRYCRKHGYPRGDDATYPPRPRSAGPAARVVAPWSMLRTRALRGAAGQLDLLAE